MGYFIILLLIIVGYLWVWHHYGRHDAKYSAQEDENTMHLVVAGNYEQYRVWLDENFGPGYHKNVKYVGKLDDIRGYYGKGVRVHYIGTYLQRKDLDRLQAEAAAHNLVAAV